MNTWRDHRILDLFGIEVPILQAPMAGASSHEMAIAVAKAGGLGSLPCALLNEAQVRSELAEIRAQVPAAPLSINFFCHRPPEPDLVQELQWRERLRSYYLELGLDPTGPHPSSSRNPFDAAMCALVEEFRPAVVSFHFGLPALDLLSRVKATGAKVISSATTVAEARWLEGHGVDAIVAQGSEAGGHRGIFLQEEITTQLGTFALVPQVVDAVSVPVIASGGITDARGIVAAIVLGACAVQIGTAYLYTPEAKLPKLPKLHRAALRSPLAETTALTNLFTGRPARGMVNRLMREVGPISTLAPSFPLAGGVLAPLRAAAEAAGSDDFMSLWAGQAAPLAKEMSAGPLTRLLAEQALEQFRSLGECIGSVSRPSAQCAVGDAPQSGSRHVHRGAS
ncbi:nitronate monooxygenase [Variovorax sp. J31P207]|uniref:NAD(P)H-dependent flavin oxidoreductase n=1 Tax=Variovorax sp. J31P207 TaxID=3053510 RepID=UPI00257804AC|nr:nitronate monooxygenase [Variovorax sp. J31P207]MDM0071620.1 nitronate monooxygenase [Variovorax sp. J31P207]